VVIWNAQGQNKVNLGAVVNAVMKFRVSYIVVIS
jgi:hypothetical protein